MRIDEMPAGREMDKAISQHVFGNTEFCCKDYDDDYHAIKEPNGCFVNYELVPRYSTDIAAAWEVLNKFTHKEPCINYLNDLWNPVGWHCHIDGHHTEGCDTAPLAICRCALKVEGVEI